MTVIVYQARKRIVPSVLLGGPECLVNQTKQGLEKDERKGEEVKQYELCQA